MVRRSLAACAAARLTAAAARDVVDSLITNTRVIQATALNGKQGSVTLYAEDTNFGPGVRVRPIKTQKQINEEFNDEITI